MEVDEAEKQLLESSRLLAGLEKLITGDWLQVIGALHVGSDTLGGGADRGGGLTLTALSIMISSYGAPYEAAIAFPRLGRRNALERLCLCPTLGGSLVILTPFWRILTGNLGLG